MDSRFNLPKADAIPRGSDGATEDDARRFLDQRGFALALWEKSTRMAATLATRLRLSLPLGLYQHTLWCSMIDALLNVAAFAVLVLIIAGFGVTRAHKRGR